MIGTHTPKLANAKLKQNAIRAKLLGAVPPELVCSQTVEMRREYWALPRNAANMKLEKGLIAEGGFDTAPVLPPVQDPNVKQVLLPLPGWHQGYYVSVSPVYSCGVLHELGQRLFERKLLSRQWIIQPTPAAMANHGEMLLQQSGAVRLMTRGCRSLDNQRRGAEKLNFVQVTARVERMNISSGLVCVGWPALTAVGGLVHALERQLGFELEFAYGQRTMQRVEGVPKFANPGGNPTPASRTERAGMAYGPLVPRPAFSAEEVHGNGEIVLLLRNQEHDGRLAAIARAFASITRLAGGALRDVGIEIRRNARAPAAEYMHAALPASAESEDTLDTALRLYAGDGEWVQRRWYQSDPSHLLSLVGYGYLEAPSLKPNVRDNYPHAWAEPLFGHVRLGRLEPGGWWRRESGRWGARWCAVAEGL